MQWGFVFPNAVRGLASGVLLISYQIHLFNVIYQKVYITKTSISCFCVFQREGLRAGENCEPCDLSRGKIVPTTCS